MKFSDQNQSSTQAKESILSHLDQHFGYTWMSIIIIPTCSIFIFTLYLPFFKYLLKKKLLTTLNQLTFILIFNNNDFNRQISCKFLIFTLILLLLLLTLIKKLGIGSIVSFFKYKHKCKHVSCLSSPLHSCTYMF